MRPGFLRLKCADRACTDRIEDKETYFKGMQPKNYYGIRKLLKVPLPLLLGCILLVGCSAGNGVINNGNAMESGDADMEINFSPASDKYLASLDKEFDRKRNEILNSRSEYTTSGSIYYVSNKGDDSFDGKSPETAWTSLDIVNSSKFTAGDTVLFERGGLWRGYLNVKSGVTYSAYGKGNKPEFYGSLDAADASCWLETEKAGLYVYKEPISVPDSDVGQIIFNEGKAWGIKMMKYNRKDMSVDIGTVSNGISVFERPSVYFANQNDLVNELEFYHNCEDSKLYLYSPRGNPGVIFDSVEIGTRGNIIRSSKSTGSVIDNLCVKYTGSHGVGLTGVMNFTCRNCEIGYVGGSIQKNDVETAAFATRYGNGFENWAQCDGLYLYDTYIYNTYDCGPTFQSNGNPGSDTVMQNVEFSGNLLYNAPLEAWMSAPKRELGELYLIKNVDIHDNISKFDDKGWNSQRPFTKKNYCMFYGGGITTATYEDCKIRDNIFYGERNYVIRAYNTHTRKSGFNWSGNTIIKELGSNFAQMPADLWGMAGAQTEYTYTEITVRTMFVTGALGKNTFMYTEKAVE